MNIFPPRNLPGSASEWGRSVEDSLRTSDKGVSDSAQSFSNLERATGGQLAKSSSLVTELLSRSAEVAYLNDMSVSSGSVTQTHTFSGVSGGRSGFLVFQSFSSSVPSPSSAPLAVFIRSGGTLLMRLIDDITAGLASNPVESSSRGTVFGFCRFDLPAGSNVPITVELARATGTPASTISLTGINLSLTRSGV